MTSAAGSPLPTFRLDVQYTRLVSAFAAENVTTLLLKGPAFDQLLFAGARKRDYSDIDLLVDPSRAEDAARLMAQLGFERAEKKPGARLGARVVAALGLLSPGHATAWVRDRDKFTVDLHHTLPLVPAGADDVWLALASHRATITVVGSPIETIDEPASALLIALHAAHHGPAWRRTRTDLDRACEVLSAADWSAAAQLARVLEAETAMGIGLGTAPAGCAVARALGLRTRPSPARRLIWSVTAWVDRRRAPAGEL